MFQKLNLMYESDQRRSLYCSAYNATKLSAIIFLILIKNAAQIGSYASATDNIQSAISTNNNNNNNKNYNNNAAAVEPFDAGAAPEISLYDTHRLAKRMDLESCLGQFDVHKNTIIRTGESQAIGGKYLQGIELDTMEECQRLCCETESCDVYIFEDKNDGYCYLFECGPPENFHCKFTRHANYTSAVLTAIRRINEVTTPRPRVSLPHIGTTNISQQEWELTNLKVKPEIRDKQAMDIGAYAASGGVTGGNSGGAGSAAAATTTSTMYQSQMQPADMSVQQQVQLSSSSSNSNGHCGRFQFTCHSGECIAVYNACDGIPQCEDGSDEGPECSGATSASSSSASALSTTKVIAEPSNVNIIESVAQKSAVAPQYQSSLLQQTVQQQLKTVQQQQQQQQSQKQQQLHQQQQQVQSVITPPLINNREDVAAWANRKMVADAQQSESTNIISDDLNSRIFNHKGGIHLPGGNGLNAYTSVMNPNLNSLYNGIPQRSNAGVGIYIPQDLHNGLVYTATSQQQQLQPQQPQQQQQFMLPQGHIILPANMNWPQQQQHQQMLTQQQSIASAGGTQLGVQQPQQQQSSQQLTPGTAYVVNAPAAVAPQSQTQKQLSENAQAKSISTVTSQAGVPLQATAHQTAGIDVVHTSIDATKSNKANNVEKASAAPEHVLAADEYEDSEEKSTEPPKKKQHKHKKLKTRTNETKEYAKPKDPIELALEQQNTPLNSAPAASPVHEQYKMIHESLAMEFRDHDGQSERPGGAVLSLTLGLLVTAALAILIGCRMRTVGRRARRLGGKTPYANEADFLVNGMYL